MISAIGEYAVVCHLRYPLGTLRIRSMERSPALSLDERIDNAGSVHFNSVGSVSSMVLSVALPVSLSGDQCHHAIH